MTNSATAPSNSSRKTIRKNYPYWKSNVDPGKLRVTGNSREVQPIRETRPDLIASIIQHGVHPKISVINAVEDPDGELRVIVGFSRAAAAAAVKEGERPDLMIGVLVHEPGTRREDLISQANENINRKGYTTAEEALLYEQLALEGLDDEAIAREVSVDPGLVKAGRRVAASPRTRQAAMQMPEADLWTLGKLAEFADNEDVHNRLANLAASNPDLLDDAILRIRDTLASEALRTSERDRLTKAGYTLLDDRYDIPDTSEYLAALCPHDSAAPLEPADHSDCPGRAAHVHVDLGQDVTITEVCLDFAKYGHRTLSEVNIAAAEEQLRQDGIRIVDPESPTVLPLRRLFADADKKTRLTPEAHATCPGHAAFVEDDGGSTAAVYFACDAFTAHGHAHDTPDLVPERDRAYKSGELKRAESNNSQWKHAKKKRRAKLELYFEGWRQRKELPSRLQHWLGLASTLAADYLSDAAPAHQYACGLLGLNEPTADKPEDNPLVLELRKKSTTETQAMWIRLAMVIGACEEHWNKQYTNNADASWRNPSVDCRFYFELLAATVARAKHVKYIPDDVEKLINNPEIDVAKWPHLEPTTFDNAA